jgi:hypothetical protein
MDEKQERIDSSIILFPGTQKDFYLKFKSQDDESSTYRAYLEAAHVKDARLIESFRDIQARLTWHDVSPNMKEEKIPFGAWLIEYLDKQF